MRRVAICMLHRPDARLDFGPAFGFLEFVFHLLARHAQFLLVLPELKRHIEGRDDNQAETDNQQRHAADLQRT